MPFYRGTRQSYRDRPPDQPVLRGLFAWFKAYEGVTTSGSNVTIWQDQINGIQATPGTAPTVTANAKNGLSAITFNGSTQVLKWDSGLGFTNNVNGISCSAAINPNTFNVGVLERPVYLGTGTSIATRFALQYPLGVAPLGRALSARRLDGDGVATQTSSSTFGTGWEITSHIMDYANKLGSIYRNGSQILAPTVMLTTGNTSATDSLGNSFGAAYLSTIGPTFTQYFNGSIGEILLYNVALTQAEALQNSRYLNSVWEIY